MLESWSDNLQTIQKEINAIILRKITIHLYFRGQKPHAAQLIALDENSLGNYLVISKNTKFSVPNEQFLITYHIKGSLMRGFQTSPHLEDNDELKVHFPTEILQIQRRKHTRFTLGPRSKVLFTRKNKSKLNPGIIENISLEGARLVGNFSKTLKFDDILCPATLTLSLEKGDIQETIIIPEVIVKRVENRSDEEISLGVYFHLDEPVKSRLENFISLCNMLEKTSNKKCPT